MAHPQMNKVGSLMAVGNQQKLSMAVVGYDRSSHSFCFSHGTRSDSERFSMFPSLLPGGVPDTGQWFVQYGAQERWWQLMLSHSGGDHSQGKGEAVEGPVPVVGRQGKRK